MMTRPVFLCSDGACLPDSRWLQQRKRQDSLKTVYRFAINLQEFQDW